MFRMRGRWGWGGGGGKGFILLSFLCMHAGCGEVFRIEAFWGVSVIAAPGMVWRRASPPYRKLLDAIDQNWVLLRVRFGENVSALR